MKRIFYLALSWTFFFSGCGALISDPGQRSDSADGVEDSGFADFISSGLYHDVGQSAMSLKEERKSGATLPTGQREIPLNADTETIDTGVVHDMTGVAACGSSGTIPERMADCLTVNGASLATWKGQELGSEMEGEWRLVVLADVAAVKYAVWADLRTKLLWSQLYDTAGGANWCEASGNSETDCAANTTSYCTDSAALLNHKGNLSANSFPTVYWRLPKLAELRLAVLDGLRFVWSYNSGAAPSVWTGNTDSQSFVLGEDAHSLNLNNLQSAAAPKAVSTLPFTCVGRSDW